MLYVLELVSVVMYSSFLYQGQEKLLAERRVPSLQSQLEEYKNALWQLQTQKQRLQTEVGHGDNGEGVLNWITVLPKASGLFESNESTH